VFIVHTVELVGRRGEQKDLDESGELQMRRPRLYLSNSLVCFTKKQTVLAAIVSFDDYLHTLRVSLYDYIGNYFLVLERITYNTNNVHAYKDTTAAIESQQSNLPKFTVQSVSSWE
jgi:hypothetical protein